MSDSGFRKEIALIFENIKSELSDAADGCIQVIQEELDKKNEEIKKLQFLLEAEKKKNAILEDENKTLYEDLIEMEEKEGSSSPDTSEYVSKTKNSIEVKEEIIQDIEPEEEPGNILKKIDYSDVLNSFDIPEEILENTHFSLKGLINSKKPAWKIMENFKKFVFILSCLMFDAEIENIVSYFDLKKDFEDKKILEKAIKEWKANFLYFDKFNTMSDLLDEIPEKNRYHILIKKFEQLQEAT